MDRAAGSITTSTGELLASGVERLAGQWVKVWGDLRNKDGEIFVSLSLLEGPNERHVFKAAGQVVTFGASKYPHREFQKPRGVALPLSTCQRRMLISCRRFPIPHPDRINGI